MFHASIIALLFALPVPELEARVTNSLGESVAGVPVCLRWKMIPSGRMQIALSAETDRHGLARLDGALEWRTSTLELWPAAEFCVALDLCLEEVAAQAFGEASTDAIELELPWTGSVEVRFITPEGRRQQPALPVRLGPDGWPTRPFLAWEAERERPPGAASAETHDGRAEFAHVGLDLQLLAAGKLNAASDPRWKWFTTASLAGGSTRVTLELDDKLAGLIGRLVDVDGAPVTDAHVELRRHVPLAHIPYSAVGWRAFSTDSDGSFALDLEAHALQSAGDPILLRLEREGGAWWLAEIPIDALHGGELHDLGDVRLGPAPLLCSGRVVDRKGRPIRGAWIRLDCEFGADLWGEPAPKHAPRPPDAVSDASGSFTVHGIPRGSARRLTVDAAGFLFVRLTDVPSGARELEVQLARSGTLEARLALPRGADPSELEVHIRSLQEQTDPRFLVELPRGSTVRLKDWFRSRDTPCGPADIEVLYRNRILRAKRVEIAEGKPTRIALDLGDLNLQRVLRLRDEDGERIERARFLVRAVGAGTLDELLTAHDLWYSEPGVIELEWTPPVFDLLASAPRYRPARFRIERDTREIVLTPR